MPLGTEELQIYYEISISIGSGLDYRGMLKDCLGKYLRKLNLSAGCVFTQKESSGGLLSFEAMYMLPKLEVVNRAKQVFDVWIDCQTSLNAVPDSLERLPVVFESNAGEFTHIFPLPGFGVLVLVKNGLALSTGTVHSLAPLNNKLANALRACLQKEKLAESEKRLADANRQLKELDTDKLAFIQYISHELNTPLNWIGSLHMIDREGMSSDSLRCFDFVSRGFKRISTLAQLASKYFEKARLNWPGQPSSLDLLELQVRLLNKFSSAAERRGVELHLTGAWAGEVVLDIKGLEEVVSTLTENAIVFSDMGDSVSISLERSDSTLSVIVQDEGVGIEEGVLRTIFKPCQTPEHKRAPGGYGFSLPRAHLICVANGWDLKASSEGSGRGSRFDLRINVIRELN